MRSDRALAVGAGPLGPRVTVCFDPDDDVAFTRRALACCGPGTGRIALDPGPDTHSSEHLMLHLLAAVGALWRVPDRLGSGRTRIAGEDAAMVGSEISWALHRAGISELWVLRASTVSFPGWRWLRDTAERENLRLVLIASGEPPLAEQAAALRGCRVQFLDPDRLCPARERPSPPWWQTPPFARRATGTARRSSTEAGP